MAAAQETTRGNCYIHLSSKAKDHTVFKHVTETSESSRFLFEVSQLEGIILYCFQNGVYFKAEVQNAHANRYVFLFAWDNHNPIGINGDTNLYNFRLICDLTKSNAVSDSFSVVTFYPVRTRTNNNVAQFNIPNYPNWRFNST